MSMPTHEGVRECGTRALDVLERLVRDKPTDTHQGMSDVVRDLVRCRDQLIVQRRCNSASSAVKERLDSINAILSVAVGAQHPVVGIKPDRIELARDALRNFLGST